MGEYYYIPIGKDEHIPRRVIFCQDGKLYFYRICFEEEHYDG
jgi:hypothetical protein